MWFKNIFRRPPNIQQPNTEEPLFDERFLRRLERLSLQANRTLRGRPARGEHPSRYLIPSTIFSDHRSYTNGDDLRYVDWNAYARQDHLLLKLGEAEQDINVHLLLDVSRSMAWGTPSKLRVMQQLAAAIGYLSLAHSDRLTIVPFGATTQRYLGPIEGKRHTIPMLNFIEAIQLQQETNISDVLQSHALHHQRGGLLMLCSDLLSPGSIAQGLEKLTPPHWHVMVLHIIDSLEIHPVLQGTLELYDSETEQHIALTLDETVIAAYHQRVVAWQEQMAMTCTQYGASYARILTTMPLEHHVMPYLRKRRLIL